MCIKPKCPLYIPHKWQLCISQRGPSARCIPSRHEVQLYVSSRHHEYIYRACTANVRYRDAGSERIHISHFHLYQWQVTSNLHVKDSRQPNLRQGSTEPNLRAKDTPELHLHQQDRPSPNLHVQDCPQAKSRQEDRSRPTSCQKGSGQPNLRAKGNPSLSPSLDLHVKSRP